MIRPSVTSLASSQPLDSAAGKLASSMVLASELVDDRLVDQVATDLTALPEPWLKKFDSNGVAFVVMSDNETLADTPYLPTFTDEKCKAMIEKARPQVQAAVDAVMAPLKDITDPGELAYYQRGLAEELKGKLEELSNQGLGFSVGIGRETKALSFMAAEHGVDPTDAEEVKRWGDRFQDLNGDLVKIAEDGTATPQQGFFLVPYVVYKNKPVRALSLPSFKSITGYDVQRTDGAHYRDNQLVLLHETTCSEPSMIKGRHKTSLHESGHIMDWVCRDIPDAHHKEKVDQLFAEACKTNNFLTDRARDSAEEFLAEAVEAYLTVEVGDEGDRHKRENNRAALEKANPALFEHVEWMVNTALTAGSNT